MVSLKYKAHWLLVSLIHNQYSDLPINTVL